jgi:hypothetical protein
MWMIVSWLVDHLAGSGALGLAAIRLLASIAAGCLIYVSVLTVLYLIAGKPLGAERLVYARMLLWIRAS